MLMRLQLSDLEIQVHHREVCARVCVRALEHEISVTVSSHAQDIPELVRLFFENIIPLENLWIMKRFWVQNSCFDKYHQENEKSDTQEAVCVACHTLVIRAEEAFVPPT